MKKYDTSKLKYLVTLRNQNPIASSVYIGMEHVQSWTGKLDSNIALKPLDDLGSTIVFRAGDVCFGKLRPYLAKAFTLDNSGACSSEFLVMKPNLVNSKFLLYSVLNKNFIEEVNSSTYGARMPRASWDFVGGLQISNPPLHTQCQIATYLDKKTEAIDTLIAKKQRMIELLEEKRSALINHVVTKGLNPDAPMKDSGVPWIGEVPAHWKVIKLGYVAALGNGSTPSRSNSEYWNANDVVWLNSSQINQGVVSSADQSVSLRALKECHLPLLTRGDILIAITGEGQTRGRAALLDMSQATISQHLVYVSLREADLSSLYLWQFIMSRYEWLRHESSGVGGTRSALSVKFLKDIKVLIPSQTEQREISQTINRGSQRILKLKADIKNQVTKLQEYRQALITAAVTGKIDVTADPMSEDPEDAASEQMSLL